MLKVLLMLLISMEKCVLSTNNTALFITIPFIGHANPLLSQAHMLKSRGWNVYIMSCSNIQNYIEQHAIEFIDIGYCSWADEFDVVQRQMNENESFLDDSDIVINWTIDSSIHMYTQSVKILQKKKLNITIGIVDMGTFAGIDICDTLNIRCIINNAGILPFLEEPIRQTENSHSSKKFLKNFFDGSIKSLFKSFFRPFMRSVMQYKIQSRYDSRWNTQRLNIDLKKPISLAYTYSRNLILSNIAFGLERVRSIPANIQLTGPMFNMNIPSETYLNELSVNDRKWLENDDKKPAVYVSFGTVATLSKDQIEKLTVALSSNKFRVIWKLNQKDAQHLSNTTISESIRIVNWISSTLGHVAHPNVKLFISHCGINSAYESIWLGTPILCIPMFYDQYTMANQVSNAGVGTFVNKYKFTSNELNENIIRMLENKTYSSNIQRLQSLIKLHGGVHRAVDIIETVARFGLDTLLPKYVSTPFYVTYNIDTYILWILVIIGTKRLISYSIKRLYRTKTNLIVEIKKVD